MILSSFLLLLLLLLRGVHLFRLEPTREPAANEAGEKKLAGGPKLAQEIGEAVVARLREWLPLAPVLENLPAFLKRIQEAPAPAWLVPGLIPDQGICLWHGQPRDFKTFCALEVGLALAAGRPAFHHERFRVVQPVRVAYFSEEDPEPLVAARLHWLTVNTGVPTDFYPFIRKCLSFDDADGREYILQRVRDTKAQVSFFDPVRSFTGLSDKGPAELRLVTVFLRQIQNETASKTLVNVHHDTKPLPIENDARARSQRASGGGIFSISDCPVSFQKLAWNKVAVFPEDYKLSGDPKPFEVTFETDARIGENGPCFGSWVRPVAVTKVEQDIVAGADAQKILTFLRAHAGQWFTAPETETGAHIRTNAARSVLATMADAQEVRCATGDEAKALGRSAKAKLYAAVVEAETSQAERTDEL